MKEARVSAAERDAGKPCGISGPLLLTRDLFSPRLKDSTQVLSVPCRRRRRL